jgi:hypothetical protein
VSSLRFRALIEIANINPYVLISARRAARLRKGWRKPLPVGDGSFYLYLHGQVRKASGTKVGDTVTVALGFDDKYRSGPAHPMPSWFSDALDRNETARRAWTELIPSRQKEILRYFSQLKSPDAQARNLKRAIHALSGGKARFMARSWNER